jgi:hypothetical protein
MLDEVERFTFRSLIGNENKNRRIDCYGIMRLSICVLTLVGLLYCAKPGSTVVQNVGSGTYMAVDSATQLTRVNLQHRRCENFKYVPKIVGNHLTRQVMNV